MTTTALILGGASCLWDDVRALEQLIGRPWDGLVIAVNDAGWAWPRELHHWVSLHPKKFGAWRAMRSANGYPDGYTTWGGTWVTGVDDSALVDRVLPVTRVGSSGYHAVPVAFEAGADRAVLAGIPMDAAGHFFDPKPWDSAMAHRDAWKDSVEEFDGRVRSMSGWTRELLGGPTVEWLRTPALTPGKHRM